MRYPFLYLLIFLFTFACQVACKHHENIPADVMVVVKKAGTNGRELMEAITHYQHPSDSVKLQATYFIIRNMDGFSFYEGEVLRNYAQYLKLVRRDPTHGEYIMNSFTEMYGAFSYDKLNLRTDIETIKASEIIANIDMAFKVWKEQPWGKDYNFQEFCEYILPFRIAGTTPEYHREEIYHQFNGLLDSVRNKGGNAVDACKALNDVLISNAWLFSLRNSFLQRGSATDVIKYRAGNCDAMSDLATYVMRSVGIPVGNDFVPQWPTGKMGHNWNVVPDKNGHTIMFLGAEDSPGTPHKPGTSKGKVYRRTYAINNKSLACLRDTSDVIPPLFLDPRIVDVTDLYTHCFNITRSLPDVSSQKYAYLSMFNGTDWVPVDWSRISDSTAKFNKVEGGILYLATVYVGGNNIPAGDPFILEAATGRVRQIAPAFGSTTGKMTLNRLYADRAGDFLVDALTGGVFEGANSIDFSHADTLFNVRQRPMPFLNEVTTGAQKTYRYVRYLSAPNRFCSLAELEWYSASTKLKGTLIGPEEIVTGGYEPGIAYVQDGNFTTCYESKAPSGGWVGLDLGKQMKVDKIKFAATANAKPTSYVMPGHQYELFYWNGNWTSLGVQVATAASITFQTRITNALFLLRDLTTNTEQRPFTYEKNQQVWW
jgi:hypothetical protein